MTKLFMTHFDAQIFDLISQENDRQTRGLELIASENYVSKQVLTAIGSILTNKYAEGLPGKRYYGGCEIIDSVEQLAIDRLKSLFGASWVNVQPHSGTQANIAVMFAILKPGDKILGLDLCHGGHLSHGSKITFSGKIYQSVFYGVNKDTEQIDYDNISSIAIREKPSLIICGASAYSRDWNYKRLRNIADELGAFLLADIAHTAGLISRGLLNNPLPYCHFITTTTHKTLRGPRGGAIMIGNDFDYSITRNGKDITKKISLILDKAVFPGTQGGPLENIIAAKAVSFFEASSDDYLKYVKQVIKNAQALAKAFADKGYRIVSNGTDNHLFLVDLSTLNITGKQAEDILVTADITVNKNMIPFDKKSPFLTSGIRLGTPAITTRGMKEHDMLKIADLIDTVLKNISNSGKISEIKQEVNEWMKNFSIP